jgi:endonuclease/exonuclease/phosphatase family metal-dependent hydrolase
MRFAAVRVGLVFLLAVAMASAATLRIGTYNVENYGPANRMTAAGYRKDYPKPEEAERALRAVIRAMDADLLFLQEMGGPAHLEELRRDLAAEGLTYAHATVLEAADDDRHIALLARQSPLAVVPHRELRFKYFGEMAEVKRGLLEVRLATASGEITVWAVHLKSRYTNRPDDPLSAKRRAGEAMAIRNHILARFPDPTSARFLVLGDFNDAKASAPVRYLLKRGDTVIAHLLPAADSRGETWTYFYGKEDTYQRVDHILVSPGLRTFVQGGCAVIQDGPETKRASDHRPACVTLEIPEPVAGR